MLDIYWSVSSMAFVILGVFLLIIHHNETEEYDKYFNDVFMVFGGVTMTYVFLWSRLESSYFPWLASIIPSGQAELQSFTVWFLVFLTWILSIVIPFSIAILFVAFFEKEEPVQC